MTRVFIDGFETLSLDLWDSASTASIVSTVGLDMPSSYCLRTGTSYVYKYMDCGENYYAFRLRLYSDSAYYILTLRGDGSNSGGISFDQANHRFSFWRQGAGVVRSGPSNTIYKDITCFIQLYYKHADVAGRIILKVDDIVHIDYTGDTRGASINRFYFGNYLYLDNVVIDSSVMPERTDVGVLGPNGVGAFSDWDTSASGSNYTFVDEVPYNDSDYVASGIVNAIDTYRLEDLPSNARSVKCVQVQVRARKEADSSLEKFNFVIRNSSTNYYSDDVSLLDTFDTYLNMYSDGPTGSGIWHPSNVNTIEVGVRSRV